MNKVDIVLNLILASCGNNFDQRVMKLYADMSFNKGTYLWICQNQTDNGDVMAYDAVEYAKGDGPKPAWLSQGGL